MISQQLRKAYTEVLEILKHLPEEEYSQIPKEKIEFWKINKDENYIFTYDVAQTLSEQKILRETNAIIISLFMKNFATENQKENINKILINNEAKYQEEIREKYNPDNLFKNKISNISGKDSHDTNSNTFLVEVKELNIFQKIFDKIKRIFIKK